MKAGIITFHWATNYGAVLQAYAFQKYLQQNGVEAEIINYYPKRYKKTFFNAIKTKHFENIPKRLKDIKKEKEIKKFREKYLKTTRYYSSDRALKNTSFSYDIYFCGSDQIWNESFTLRGERKKTFAYFLDFAPDDKIMASYAASFGVTTYKESLRDDLIKQFRRLDFISLREQTGVEIINNLGFSECTLVPDPTLLLEKSDYMRFVGTNNYSSKYAFVYMLHGKKVTKDCLTDYLDKSKFIQVEPDNDSIEEWLTKIYYSEFVITNSFHGVVFSIILGKPFVALLIEGSGMNDRIVSLLSRLGLENRILDKNDSIPTDEIDWDIVYKKLDEFREKGYNYIDKVLKYKKTIGEE